MSVPDRPTREQVNEALVVVDHGAVGDGVRAVLAAEVRALRAELDAVLAIADNLDRDAPSRPSAPVLADRLRAALVARTPQPAEHVAAEASGVLWMALRYALGRGTYAVQEVGDAIAQHAHRLTSWQRERMAQEIERELGYETEGAAWGSDAATWRQAVSDLRAPLPAVPDGEDVLTVHAGALALALHDADCGCGDYDAVEDPRYITAVRAVLDNRDVTPRTTVLAAESAVGNLLFNANEPDPAALSRLIVAEIRTVLPTPVAWAPELGGEDVPARLDAADVIMRRQWAAWLSQSSDLADDLSETERHGLRIAASHLLDPAVAARARRIDGLDGEWLTGFSNRLHAQIEDHRSRAVPDRGDVPTRLDAAADTLDGSGREYPAAALRGIARVLRRVDSEVSGYPAEVRAAVASALARPTGGEQ